MIKVVNEISDSQRRRYKQGNMVNVLGRLNLKTGDSKYFNVYEEWDDTTAELWQNTDTKRNIIVFTAGSKPIAKDGEFKEFFDSQTFRFIGGAKFIDYCDINNLKDRASEWGSSLAAYGYD